jgi:branched-chain amino acid transport system substrate-binding protein
VLTDMSGTYRDPTGPGSVACTQQAAAEMAPRLPVEVLQADHQNKPDVGANIARQWYDQGVDAVVDVPTSSVALAINGIAREKNKAFLNSGAATSDLTGPGVQPEHGPLHLRHLHAGQGHRRGARQAGGDTWFFVTADYAFGHALQRDTARFVEPRGGACSAPRATPSRRPPTSPPSSSQAQSSRAKVLGLANAGTDTATCIKQAREFGLTRNMKVAGLLMSSWRSTRSACPPRRAADDRALLLGPERPHPRLRRARAPADARPGHAGAGAGRLLRRGLHYLKAWPTWARPRPRPTGARRSPA